MPLNETKPSPPPHWDAGALTEAAMPAAPAHVAPGMMRQSNDDLVPLMPYPQQSSA
jgi:hypothetical protein